MKKKVMIEKQTEILKNGNGQDKPIIRQLCTELNCPNYRGCKFNR